MRKIITKIITTLLLTLAYNMSNAQVTPIDSVTIPASIYPNPFSESVTIEHNKSLESIVSITIYDAIGNLIYTFREEDWNTNEIIWNGQQLNGSIITPGTYICHIQGKEEAESVLFQKI